MRRPPLPSLLDAGAVQLGAAMAAGEVSPVEVVDAHIARLEAINGPLNALVDQRFTAARAEARAAEAALHRRGGGPRSPLFGVPCTIQAVRNAARILEERGATIRPLRAPLLERAFEIWSAMLTEAPAASYSEVLGDGAPIRLLAELGRIPLGRRQHTLPALVVVALERLGGRLGETVATWAAAGRRLQRELEEILGPRGVLLHPPYSRAAPRHRGPLLTPLDFVCTAIFNVLELPVTQVPLGFGGTGLPLGVQVAAARGQDYLTLAVAEVLEKAGGGWRRAEPRP